MSASRPISTIVSKFSFLPQATVPLTLGNVAHSTRSATFQLPSLVSGARFRKSCYFESTVRAGVTGFSTYNSMLLPSHYSTSSQEYTNLRSNVNLWDVAPQRQIEFAGPDAAALADMVSPRSLKNMKVGDAKYAMITDEEGMVMNDPVVLRLSEDRFWFSIADSDVMFWFKGLASSRGMNVRIFEADVSPCAVQGPKSLALMVDLFGEWVRDLKFYGFKETELDGIPLVLVRAGWSPERGYELFLQDESRGNELWERLMDAGEKYNILPGVPHQTRRIEGGLLNFGSDITMNHHVLDLGLPSKWFKLNKDAPFMGQASVERMLAEGGSSRRIMGLKVVDEEPVSSMLIKPWPVLSIEGESVGSLTSFTYSPLLEAHIGIATLPAKLASPGSMVHIDTPDGERRAVVQELPFSPRVH